MDEEIPIEEVIGYFRLAVPLMTKHGIPVTPKNYTVWYKYASAADSNLTKAIDAILEKGDQFTAETNETLFRQFCTEGDVNELKKFRDDLQQIVLTLFRQVTDLTGHTESYESFIEASVKMLSEDTSVESVKKFVGDLVRETKTIGKLGKTIQNELKETTKALEVLKQDFEQLKIEALVDFLTGLPNRKAFAEALATNISQATSDDKTLCLLIIDIDNFKKFNDKFGHLMGDGVLKFVARKIKEMVRGSDCPARFGGEEFAVILPQTPFAGAKVVAETVRSFFAKAPLRAVPSEKSLGTLTVSIGVACYRPGESSDEFIGRCDQALYLAKQTGRNRVATEYDAARNPVESK